jgi:uncharacterized membrane protein
MAFCPQCGSAVGDRDQFCGKCGARQPTSTVSDFWSSLSPRNVALLCYIPWIGWIASIVVLASERFRADRRIRFHAFQGLYLFVAWLMVEWVVSPFVGIPGAGLGIPVLRLIPRLLQVVVLGAWIFMLVKVTQDQDYRLPLLGELADRSVSEQRT